MGVNTLIRELCHGGQSSVWIEPLVESELDEVRKLIEEHSDAVLTPARTALMTDGSIRLVFYVEDHDVERVEKQFRRLNRGPVKFKAVW